MIKTNKNTKCFNETNMTYLFGSETLSENYVRIFSNPAWTLRPDA